jgi:hypothetical protein
MQRTHALHEALRQYNLANIHTRREAAPSCHGAMAANPAMHATLKNTFH